MDVLPPKAQVALSQSDYEELDREINLARVLSLVAEYLRPKAMDGLSIVKAEKMRSSEIVVHMKVALNAGMVPILFRDFLGKLPKSYNQVNAVFHDRVEDDLDEYLHHMNDELAEGNDPAVIEELMESLLGRIRAWDKLWSSGLKNLDSVITTARNPCIAAFSARYLELIHAFLPHTAFSTHLLAYFRSAMPIHLEDDVDTLLPTLPLYSFKLNPYLYRYQIIPKYINHLAQIAYEAVDLMVWREAGPCEAVGKLIERAGRELVLPDEEDREENWSARRVNSLRHGITVTVMTWLDRIMAGGDSGFQRRANIVTRLDYRMLGVLFDLRSAELFDLIVRYPESAPALQDLKECLAANRTDRRSLLVQELMVSIKRRLLHPGPRTQDVVDLYVSTIRSLRLLDPQGVLLHVIAQPIRNHIKNRPDAIKTIARLLVDGSDTIRDGDGDEEAKPIVIRDDVAEDFTDQNWEPEPIDAAPEFRSRKASDIISTLVGITNDRTLIITELSELLSQRLLLVKGYDLDEEIRTVEILKLRFGEAALPKCEVMLKDFAESKRIDAHVQSLSPSVLHPIILSRHYWPEIGTTPLCIPQALVDMQSTWNSYYARHKQGRQLHWRAQAGTVGLKIELQDRVVEVEATTLQASVLHTFERKHVRKIDKIAAKLGTDDLDEVEKAINFWVNHGVLREIKKGKYALMETGGAEAEEYMAGHELEATPAPVLEPAADTRAELKELHWPEIQVVMQSSGPATASAIQAMLLQRLSGFAGSGDAIQVTLLRAEREGLVTRLMEPDGTSFWQLA